LTLEGRSGAAAETNDWRYQQFDGAKDGNDDGDEVRGPLSSDSAREHLADEHDESREERDIRDQLRTAVLQTENHTRDDERKGDSSARTDE
jgi:hypothetical protein